MKYAFIIVISCLLVSCSGSMTPVSTPIANNLTKDSKGTPMLLGHCSTDYLSQAPFSKWYDSSFNAWQPSAILPANSLDNTIIEVFMGTWCGDSRREVPRLMKLLDKSGFDSNNIRLVMVDHESPSYKLSPGHEEKGKSIFRVPTIIVYKNNREAGRIIETPVESLEKDLTKIVTGQSYIPNHYTAYQWMRQAGKKNPKNEDTAFLVNTYRKGIISSSELNAMGYVFMDQLRVAAALQTFRLNTLLFPLDANSWDSLAEAYMATGNKQKAIEYYTKVLVLKPGDANATAKLARLGK